MNNFTILPEKKYGIKQVIINCLILSGIFAKNYYTIWTYLTLFFSTIFRLSLDCECKY